MANQCRFSDVCTQSLNKRVLVDPWDARVHGKGIQRVTRATFTFKSISPTKVPRAKGFQKVFPLHSNLDIDDLNSIRKSIWLLRAHTVNATHQDSPLVISVPCLTPLPFRLTSPSMKSIMLPWRVQIHIKVLDRRGQYHHCPENLEKCINKPWNYGCNRRKRWKL
jgi:hypothetical protein